MLSFFFYKFVRRKLESSNFRQTFDDTFPIALLFCFMPRLDPVKPAKHIGRSKLGSVKSRRQSFRLYITTAAMDGRVRYLSHGETYTFDVSPEVGGNTKRLYALHTPRLNLPLKLLKLLILLGISTLAYVAQCAPTKLSANPYSN